MTAPQLDRRLSPQDYAFLLMDNPPRQPMNIGSIAVFEGEIPYRDFVENIESKLHLIPRYTEIVVPAPFNIGRPTWEPDPYFDISRHIHEVWLDPPGTHDQLLTLAQELYPRPLERTKPLWEVHIVKGLASGETALITRIHHCMVDGVGGVELAMVMLDTEPNPPRVMYSAQTERRPLPSQPGLFLDALFDDFGEALDHWSAWQDRFTGLLARDERGWLHGLRRGLEAALPFFTLPVQKASFNGRMSAKREIAVARFSLKEFRAIRAATGCTINDLGLSVVAAALGRYMRENGEPTERRKLRILAPVNVRREDQSGRMGNHISMLLVEAPLWECTPEERLTAIAPRMRWLRKEHASDGVEMVAEELFSMPTPLLKAATLLGEPPNTVANMVCTNVPGPTIPLYTVGHRLRTHFALAPLGWQMGLGCAITSYDGEVAMTLLVDPELVPDVMHVRDLLVEAYFELRQAAGIEEPSAEEEPASTLLLVIDEAAVPPSAYRSA